MHLRVAGAIGQGKHPAGTGYLKPRYVDCFETLCRLPVVAAAIECVIQKGQVRVQSTLNLVHEFAGRLEALPYVGAKSFCAEVTPTAKIAADATVEFPIWGDAVTRD